MRYQTIILLLSSYPLGTSKPLGSTMSVLIIENFLNHTLFSLSDIHIYAHDYLSFRIRSLCLANQARILQSFETSCLHDSTDGFKCKLLFKFAKQVKDIDPTISVKSERAFGLIKPKIQETTIDSLKNLLLNIKHNNALKYS